MKIGHVCQNQTLPTQPQPKSGRRRTCKVTQEWKTKGKLTATAQVIQTTSPGVEAMQVAAQVEEVPASIQSLIKSNLVRDTKKQEMLIPDRDRGETPSLPWNDHEFPALSAKNLKNRSESGFRGGQSINSSTIRDRGGTYLLY
ncbi:hypothetical protein HAX54_006180 [Datura stramonium]|uniref:Uncharacterized protein n=1 Tax=Datura stramonium TaxID=4076 RepID=A0ABS8T9W2_DATST|nr:hypothetical protein [Datura stramonium]